MMQRLLRLSPLFLLSLFFFTTFAFGRNEVHDQAPVAQDGYVDQRLAEHPKADDGWGESDQGESAVHSATAILHKIKPSSSRLSTFSRPSGVIGTTAYYVKEIFFLLFMNGPPQHDLLTSQTKPKKLSPPLSQAVTLLEEAAEIGNPDAIFMLAEMNFYGNYSHPRNYSEAFRRYNQLAASGNSSAQHMVGFMYATGIGGAVKQDQAKAMLYHTFAAEGGDIRSEMTIAFRHHSGIATPRDCEEAVYNYRKVADKVMDYIRSGPPGGNSLLKESYRIADEEGGVYGEGASVSSSGPNAKHSDPSSQAHAAFDDIMEYLDLMSRKGDLKATYSLGKIYYDGGRVLKRDFAIAKQFFLQVARTYWGKDGKMKSDPPPGAERMASKAAGYLGRMFLRGEGQERNYAIAHTWFKRGISNGDALSQYSMGLMYLEGLYVARDPVKAAEYFGAAADQDLALAQVALGELFLDQGEVSTAIRYFDLAARNGKIEAYYYLAELSNQGIGRDKSCGVAAAYYKIVAEKAETLVTSFEEANTAYEHGDLETALVDYMMAAEQGFEYAQANVAYLLDQARPRINLSSIIPFVGRKASLVGDAALALIYWTRSAKQLNVDSMVKMGDYYLEGLGAPSDHEKAALCYQAAAETMQSAQAMWNLGWMHENGIGIDQDFHLAKRYYDQALETNPREAYLPVTVALYKLRMRSWWNDITNGRINSIQEEPAPKKDRSLSEWIANFLEADAAYWAAHADDYEPDDWDSQQAQHGAAAAGGDDYYDDIDTEILESLVIVALAAALAFLVWYRNQRALNQRRAAQQQQQQQQQAQQGQGQQGQGGERGLFPQPGDPEFLNWAAGGVGH